MERTRAEMLRRSGERFAELLARAERLRLRSLGFDELRELGQLYRLHAARLARLRDRDDDPDEIHHVNGLCVRAFGILYGRSGAAAARTSFAERVRGALARTWRAQVLAWVLLLAGVALGAGLASRDPAALPALVPAALGYSPAALEQLASSAEARRSFLAAEETPAAQNALFGSSLFVRNTTVGLLSFATGILAGVPTVLLQIYNGLILGALSWVFFRDPWPVPYLAWILPHAIPEVTALNLCAAAGLLLGGAVAAPGRESRARALRSAADPALLLFGASLPLFMLAAAIESFARESGLATPLRLLIAAAAGALVLGFHLSVRRLSRARTSDVSWLRDLSAPVHIETANSG